MTASRFKLVVGTFFAVSLFPAMAILTEYLFTRARLPTPGCREEAFRFEASPGVSQKQCSHEQHRLLRGDEEGKTWVCFCDEKTK